jgi:hypothetical protein
MVKITFTGAIVPGNFLINLSHGPIIWSIPDIGDVLTTVAVRGADIKVDCEISGTSDDHILTLLHWHVLHMVTGAVDVVAFSKGTGVSVVINHCKISDGRNGPIGLRDEDLVKACPMDHSEINIVVASDPVILKHLHDLVESVFKPLEAQINCARAVEGFRRLLSQGTDAQQWDFMRNNLNFSKSYLTFVTDLSREPRHGYVGPQNIGNIGKTRIHAWTVAYRFMQFRVRGNIKLPESDFPIL